MKHFLILGLILGSLVACDSNNDVDNKPAKDDSSQVRSLKEDNMNLSKKLETCQEMNENLNKQLQAQASAPQNDASSSQPEQASEPEAPPEPEKIQGVEAFFSDAPKGIKCEKAEESACGLNITGCINGFDYACVKDVKYRDAEFTK